MSRAEGLTLQTLFFGWLGYSLWLLVTVVLMDYVSFIQAIVDLVMLLVQFVIGAGIMSLVVRWIFYFTRGRLHG